MGYQISKACFKCEAYALNAAHTCPQQTSTRENDQACPEFGCEQGFGYCPELGEAVQIGGVSYPKGGQGITLWLDNEMSFKNSLIHLERQPWIDNQTDLITVKFTAITSHSLYAHINLYFQRKSLFQFEVTYTIDIGETHDNFPTSFGQIWKKDDPKSCQFIRKMLLGDPYKRSSRDQTSFTIVVFTPCIVLLALIVETQHFDRWCTGSSRPFTFTDHVNFGLNIFAVFTTSISFAMQFMAKRILIRDACERVNSSYADVIYIDLIGRYFSLF